MIVIKNFAVVVIYFIISYQVIISNFGKIGKSITISQDSMNFKIFKKSKHLLKYIL